MQTKSIPFYFRGAKSRALLDSVTDFRAVVPQVTEVMRGLKRQRNIRHMVLDSWNLLDYMLRRNLCIIFGLQRYETSIFDPKYDLLPRSFERLLVCLNRLRASQGKLPNDSDPYDESMRIPLDFWLMLEHQDKEKARWLEDFVEQYYRKKLPKVWRALYANPSAILSERRPKNLSGQYRDYVLSLDERWQISAATLQKARNIAVHTLDANKVAAVFGANGPNKASIVRTKCLGLLKELIGLKMPR